MASTSFYFILFFSPLLAVRIISFPPCESDYLGKAPGNQTAGLKRGITLDTTTEITCQYVSKFIFKQDYLSLLILSIANYLFYQI